MPDMPQPTNAMPHHSPKPVPAALMATMIPRLFGHGHVDAGTRSGPPSRRLWLWIVVSAVLLVAVGVWTHWRVASALQIELAADLRAMLSTKLAWVELWYDEQTAAIEAAAKETFTRESLEQLAHVAEQSPEDDNTLLLNATAAAEFRRQLLPVLRAGRFSGFILTDANGRILAASQARLIGRRAFADHPQQFVQRTLAGETLVTRPYPSVGPLPDARGVEKVGRPTMFACAQVVAESGRVLGVLGLRVDPLLEFTRTLNAGRLGETGEAIAFDAQGLFLTPSRYEQVLKSTGLLPDRPDATSLLTAHVRLPNDAASTPMSQSLSGTEGCDTAGYQNYRAAGVVGAWAWLPEQRLGIVVEMDAEEAHRPLRKLTHNGWLLLTLLGTSTILVVATSVYGEQLRRRFVNVAERLERFGQYTLEDKIGEGAMGTIYRARHALLQRPTAIKLLRDTNVTDADAERFSREVQLTSLLSHPNIVTVYDYGRGDNGRFFFVMEFLHGLNLQQVVAASGPLADGRVLRILEQICAALACAHAYGLLHRDIKPENVMLQNTPGAPDLVKVLDFGLAKPVEAMDDRAALTQPHLIVGTPLYMAPERFNTNATPEARSDLYSVAAVGYFLLTGRPLFDSQTVQDVLIKQTREAPTPPSCRRQRPLSADLEAVILQCLSKSPDDRPANAETLRQQLLRCTPTEPWSDSDAENWWTTHHAVANLPGQMISTVIEAVAPPVSNAKPDRHSA